MSLKRFHDLYGPVLREQMRVRYMSTVSMSPIPSFDRQCARLKSERGLHDGAWFIAKAREDYERMTRPFIHCCWFALFMLGAIGISLVEP